LLKVCRRHPCGVQSSLTGRDTKAA
jgi:hypothetical protein